MGERRGIYKVLVEIPVETRPLGRPSQSNEDVTMDLNTLRTGDGDSRPSATTVEDG
jgi:hypothetical protein